MRTSIILSAAIVFVSIGATAFAEKIESGLQVGKAVTAFGATKCGGIDDGVSVGARLSYR